MRAAAAAWGATAMLLLNLSRTVKFIYDGKQLNILSEVYY